MDGNPEKREWMNERRDDDPRKRECEKNRHPLTISKGNCERMRHPFIPSSIVEVSCEKTISEGSLL
jgi:hypothetical protein